jgi:cytochrome b561
MADVQGTTDEAPQYGGVSKLLHWAMFALVTAQLVVAWTMPEIEWGTEPEFLINLHLSLGVLLMLLVIVRLAWRVAHPTPPLPGTPAWQRWTAGLTHAALYVLLLVLPITGWAAASARGWPVTLFGIFTLPQLVHEGTKFGFKAGDMHADLLSWVLLGLVGVHVVAALYHHFVRQDFVLRRMLPGRNSRQHP